MRLLRAGPAGLANMRALGTEQLPRMELSLRSGLRVTHLTFLSLG
jgi:hypothetical protein